MHIIIQKLVLISTTAPSTRLLAWLWKWSSLHADLAFSPFQKIWNQFQDQTGSGEHNTKLSLNSGFCGSKSESEKNPAGHRNSRTTSQFQNQTSKLKNMQMMPYTLTLSKYLLTKLIYIRYKKKGKKLTGRTLTGLQTRPLKRKRQLLSCDECEKTNNKTAETNCQKME